MFYLSTFWVLQTFVLILSKTLCMSKVFIVLNYFNYFTTNIKKKKIRNIDYYTKKFEVKQTVI